MHEFSLCEGIVESVAKELAKIEQTPIRLLAVRIVVGELHQIVADTLVFAYEVLTRDTQMAGSVLEISISPIACKCNECAWEGRIEQPLFRCGKCGAGNVEVVKGKELFIDCLEVDLGE